MRAKIARSVAGIVPQRDLEDVVQDTFLRIRDVQSVDEIKNPESFIYRTARNLALDHVKRAESRLADGHDNVEALAAVIEQSEEDSTYRAVTSRQEFGSFCSAVDKLPEACKRVFVLRKVYGFSQREIAASLGISESTVEKHVARGFKETYLTLRAGEARSPDAGRVTSLGEERAKRRKR